MFVVPDITSSYRRTDNSIGETLYGVVMELKPERIVEFGVQYGYSAVCMAQALRDLGKGHLDAYDDWVRHCSHFDSMRNIDHSGLAPYITLHTLDFYEWIKDPTPFDLLHVDIDNTGEVIELLAKTFPNKHVIFEGGIKDRDRVNMAGHKPMNGAASYTVLNSVFPGLSKLL